jgi:hypothetical protein
VKDGSGTKIDEFDDVLFGHDAVVKFEVTMSETYFVKILYAITNLAKDAIDLWTTHFSCHDDREEVVRSEFHDLV